MADPLQTTAESFAPSRPSTNFFDPSQSQDVLSRYAVAGRNVAEQEKTAELASRLAASRFQRAEERNRAADRELNLETQRRQNVRWGREEEDYQAKKDFEATRGDFIRNMSDTLAGSVGKDDFLQKLTEFQATLPPQAVEDDAIKSLVSSYLRQNEFLNMERKQNEQLERRKRLSVEAGILSQEQLAKVPRDPMTGAFDIEALHDMTVAEKARREVLEDQAKVKKEADTRETAAARAKEKERLAVEDKEAATVVTNPNSFPSEVDRIVKAKSYLNDKDFETLDPVGYKEAKAFDTERLEREYLIAQRDAYPTEASYVNAVKKTPDGKPLSEEEKENRAKIWRIAQKRKNLKMGEPVEETAATEPVGGTAAPAPAAPAPVAPAGDLGATRRRLDALRGQ